MQDEFAQRFARAWGKPTPEGLVELLRDDVVLLQPHLAPIRGKANAVREFRRLFAWLPGLHGVVSRSSQSDNVVFIEWEMKVPVGGGFVALPAVDRFILDGSGLGVERQVYFDQLQLIIAVLTRPRLWAGYARYRFGS